MASFLRTTFDNLVNNINTTINQHTNSSPGGTRTQQAQRTQTRTRTPSNRPTAQSTNSGQRCGSRCRNLPCQHSSTNQQQTNPDSVRSSRQHTGQYLSNHNNQRNTQQTSYNTRQASANVNTSSGNPNAYYTATNMSSHANQAQQNTANLPEKQLDIGDVRDPQDINQLSARQLKTILTKNCVDYKGVIEKEVLREKVMQLWIDCNEKRHGSRTNHQAGSQDITDDIDESQACKICMEREINCVLLECGHMLTCVTCGRKLAECPVCRQNVTRCVRTFKG